MRNTTYVANFHSEKAFIVTRYMKIITLLIVIYILAGSLLLAQNGEFLLDTNVTYKPAHSLQSYPALTFNGTDYFVVWYDWRNRIDYHYEDSYYSNIYGCRVTPEGVVVDSAGILISYWIWIGGYVPVEPAIAYGNGTLLCVWSDFRDNMMLYGARIDTNGTVLDPDGFAVCTFNSAKGVPSIAFDGVNFLVVWQDFRPGSYFDIYCCRISPDGTILDPEGIPISAISGYECAPSVAFDGSNYFVVWMDNRNTGSSDYDIYGARMDTAGILLDTSGIAVSTMANSQELPCVIFGGTNYFITWEDFRSGSHSDIYAARVDTAGILLDTNGIAISALPEYEHHPSLAFDGTNYLVIWNKSLYVYCTRVDTAGVVLDSGGIIVSQDGHLASAAFDGKNYFISWQANEICGARVDTAGVVIDTSIPLSFSAYTGRSSSASFDGTNYFAVWEDYRDSTSPCIYATRIDTFGIVLDPDGIPLIKGANPAIAFDGSNYLAVCSGIKGARIDTMGNVIDTILISFGGGNSAITYGDDNFFVVWQSGWDIYGARVDTSGIVLDPDGIIIAQGEYYETNPSVAFDGTNYFVVWQYGNPITPYKIYGARVDTTGVLLDTISISIAIDPWIQSRPSVAFDGTNYFVVWQDARNGWDDVEIYGTRVTPDGIVLEPSGIPVCTSFSCQYAPRIAFDGKNYCVIWGDWRNGNHSDIYGCYVTPLGEVIEEFIVSTQPNLQIEPALVKGTNKFLVTYTGFVDSIGRPANTMRIWGTFKQVTAVEEQNSGKVSVGVYDFEVKPQPAKNTFYIQFHSQDERRLSVKLYNVVGRLVKKIFDGKAKIGINELLVMSEDLSSGIYFVQLETSNWVETEKVILLK